jgi:putative radical SAM enzyme (TIGR03279 family)
VQPGSPAAAAGIKPGDILLSLDGNLLHDIIDYQFYLEPRVQAVGLDRTGRNLEVELDNSEGGDPGIVFAGTIFDRIRTCSNRCVFCFVDQVTGGLRPPLYLKDDDFRLSFLHGNFITLGNLHESDLERIIEQRLSPLYVSVHATDPEVRGRLMGCRDEDAARGLANLKRLGEAGIETHIQVVLCPGANDGAVLERTVTELAHDYPGVASIGVVPVALGEGYLRDHPGMGIRPLTVTDCATVIDVVSAWQEKFRQERGAGFIYAADEFFLKSGRPLPPPEYYDDFAQYENGIGIARSFMEEGEEPIGNLLAGNPGRAYLLTGTLAAGLIADICVRLGPALGREMQPLAAGNRLFGAHVTVTGLLGGRDIVAAARAAGLNRSDILLIPASSLDSARERFLDDVTLEELEETLDSVIIVASP